ncbi:MAG: gluconeogenesis factor YvcK family protein [Patescibacteria group bacterium]|jgi:uncharacterized cofD-like protein
MQKKRVVIIGGGTGTTVVLNKLKDYAEIEISIIVSMTDDGGSNAVIRDEFGLLPLSDLRKSIIALSENGNGILRKLFMYRFGKGKGITGHTLGNFIMMALSDITGTELLAIEAAKKLFRVRGKVIPVTLENTHLVAEYESGKKIRGEHLIDEPSLSTNYGKIKRLTLSKKVAANKEAVNAIKKADFIIAGPGDLYTTTLASLIVPGIADAIASSKAKFIFVSNLMTKYGQTNGMKASDLVAEMHRYSGRTPNFVVVHRGDLSKKVLQHYAKEKEYPIEDNLVEHKYKVVRKNLVSQREVKKDQGDSLKRSLIRHDSQKLGKVLYEIICS